MPEKVIILDRQTFLQKNAITTFQLQTHNLEDLKKAHKNKKRNS